jgi:Zn-dependent peptidase ImmA (M78 family)
MEWQSSFMPFLLSSISPFLEDAPISLSLTATEVIADFTRDAPDDVYARARALGLEIKDIKFDEDVSGKIEKNWFADTYTISINARHPVTRRRFTAAHEIAHFVLHRDIIGDGIVDDALYRSTKSDEIERQANAYAATILMPAPLVIATFRDGEKCWDCRHFQSVIRSRPN